jgi:hypothetical protein
MQAPARARGSPARSTVAPTPQRPVLLAVRGGALRLSVRGGTLPRVDIDDRRQRLRRTVVRQRRLAVDVVLARAERAWMRALDRRPPPDVDPATGRTPREKSAEDRTSTLWTNVLAKIEQGADQAELLKKIHEAVDLFGAQTAEVLRGTAPAMLREHRQRDRAFRRRLHAVWGPGLDALYAVYVSMEEIGSDLQQVHQDRDDDLTDALLGLQARASLLLYEIHTTLSAGLPLAAWARTRSLHETAVVAELLAEHSREPGTEDLATRYLAHAVMDHAEDLRLAAASGLQVDPAFAADVEAVRQDLLVQYGHSFRYPYAWARPLLPASKQCNFYELEQLANLGLNRFDYRVGSHHVHASAYTLHLNRVQRGRMNFRLTGPVNRELDGPVPVALDAALMTTRAVVYGMTEEPPSPRDLLSLSALRELAADVEPLMFESAEVLERREERVQRRRDRGTGGESEHPGRTMGARHERRPATTAR